MNKTEPWMEMFVGYTTSMERNEIYFSFYEEGWEQKYLFMCSLFKYLPGNVFQWLRHQNYYPRVMIKINTTVENPYKIHRAAAII